MSLLTFIDITLRLKYELALLGIAKFNRLVFGFENELVRKSKRVYVGVNLM